MTTGLEGRHALVTGGASGIGRAIALRLARDGADVAVLDLTRERAAPVADAIAAIGRASIPVGADVGLFAAAQAGVAEARAALGPLHVLVNCAGIADFAPLDQLTEARWDRMLAVHLKGTFACTQAAVPDMIAAGWGRVVNFSSVAGMKGGLRLAHYAAAKSGVVGFTKALAVDLGPAGITVNAIAPGAVDTPMLRGSGIPDAVLEQAQRNMPVGRLGTPDDLAAACAYLVSSEAGWITGQVLSPNGGAAL